MDIDTDKEKDNNNNSRTQDSRTWVDWGERMGKGQGLREGILTKYCISFCQPSWSWDGWVGAQGWRRWEVLIRWTNTRKRARTWIKNGQWSPLTRDFSSSSGLPHRLWLEHPTQQIKVFIIVRDAYLYSMISAKNWVHLVLRLGKLHETKLPGKTF